MPEAGIRMVYILLNEAKKRGADCLATVCPLCQFNLDAYHAPVTAQYGPVLVPTVYFTQLMGLAFGLPEQRAGPEPRGDSVQVAPCRGAGSR